MWSDCGFEGLVVLKKESICQQTSLIPAWLHRLQTFCNPHEIWSCGRRLLLDLEREMT